MKECVSFAYHINTILHGDFEYLGQHGQSSGLKILEMSQRKKKNRKHLSLNPRVCGQLHILTLAVSAGDTT